MNLFFEPGAFSWDGTMPVQDQHGHTRYLVTGNGYRRRIHVRDLAGREAILIRQVVPSMLAKYDIEIYGRPVGTLVRHPGEKTPQYVLEGQKWRLSGETGKGLFEAFEAGEVVASCVAGEREELRGITCSSPNGELTVLAVALVICCIMGPQEMKV